MEEIFGRLKASNITLDQSQVKRMTLTRNRKPGATTKGRKVFDNLGATSYASPTKSQEKTLPSSQEENGFTKKKKKTNRGSTPLFTDDSDDEMLLTGSSAHGSPSRTTRLSDLDDDSESLWRCDISLSKSPAATSKAQEASHSKSSKKAGAAVKKSPITLAAVKQKKVQNAKPRKVVKGKGKAPVFDVLDYTSTPRASSSATKKPRKAATASEANPLAELLREKREGMTENKLTPRPNALFIPDVKGKGKPMSLRAFLMNSPPSTHRNVNAFLADDDDADTLEMKDIDEINTRGGLRPFPMSSQDFEGYKTSSKPSSIASSSSTKRNSSPYPDDCSAKKQRISIGLLDDHSLADLSLTQFEERDPNTLCPFCDQPLPEFPSRLLQDMVERLRRTSYRDPRPTNALGMRAPLVKYVSLCQRHEFESKILPKARAKGWPLEIDFEALPGRIARLKNRLHKIVLDKEKSLVWKTLKKEIERKGSRRVLGLAGQFEDFKKSQPGYYGEQGALIISQALYGLFSPETLAPSATAPLTHMEFIQSILVPEAAASLVQEDMKLDTKAEALKVLEESSSYGTSMFPDLDNGGADDLERRVNVGERMMWDHVKARRKEVDEEVLLNDLRPARNANETKSKKLRKLKPTQNGDAEFMSLLNSDSPTISRSEASSKNSKRSKPAKMTRIPPSPDGKENTQQSSSSQSSETRFAVGGRRPRYDAHTRQSSGPVEDSDATPKPAACSQKIQPVKLTANAHAKILDKYRDIDVERTNKSKFTGLSKPPQVAKSRQATGASSTWGKFEGKFRMTMIDISSDEDDDPSSFPLKPSCQSSSQLTMVSKPNPRAPTGPRKDTCKWLLSDEATPESTPSA